MALFIGAIIGISALDAKIAATKGYQDTQLVPAARAAVHQAISSFSQADDDGAYHVMQRNADVSAAYLVRYNDDVVQMKAAILARKRWQPTTSSARR